MMWSKLLFLRSNKSVHTPADYGVSGKSYPVIYLLDAEDEMLSTVGIVDYLQNAGERQGLPGAVQVHWQAREA